MDGNDESTDGATIENDAPPTSVDDASDAAASRPSLRLTGERYKAGARIGRGGMGEVIAAHDEQIGREVAIKRMRVKTPTEKAMLRFEREARIQGRLDHPAIVPVHELGRDRDGLPFFAMKKLAGTTLAQILRAGDDVKYPRQRLLRAFADVCLAVEFAHTRGIVHRDLKPDNIMLGDFGEVYVLDWGVAKVLGEEDGGFLGLDSGELVTRDGIAVGTPGYMSPEQAEGRRDIDARADVYGLGCLLFEILAGVKCHPRGAAGMVSAIEGIDCHPASRAPGRDIPPELDELCAAALARTLEDRIQTARELGERAQRFLDGDRDLALRRQLACAHLAAATEAFAKIAASEDARRIAMREAGRALALDPTLAGAADLVGRLMLEPPRTMPREVEAAIQADIEQVVRQNARNGMFSYLGYLLFIPAFLWVGIREPIYVVAMTALALGNAALLRHHAKPHTTFFPLLSVIGSALIVATMARMFSPFLVAPGIAAVTAFGLAFGPWQSRRAAAGLMVLMTAAVLVPWLAEAVGLVSHTLAIHESGIEMTPVVTQNAEAPSLLILVVYTTSLVCIAVRMGMARRDAERSARRHLHLQAWQLKQLVPG